MAKNRKKSLFRKLSWGIGLSFFAFLVGRFSFSKDGFLHYYELNQILEKVQVENDALREEQKQLALEIKRLQNDSYIERVARESLGMLKPNEIFIILDSKKN